MDERQLVRWANPTLGGLPALLPPSHKWAYSFHDLVSLAVIAVMKQRQVSTSAVRQSIIYLGAKFETERPLAHKKVVGQLMTAGDAVLLGDGEEASAGGQMAMLETVETYLRRIEYGKGSRMASLWRPARYVTLDPQVQAGAPCIAGTRVPTTTVWGRMERGESAGDVAWDLELEVRAVRAAARFEANLHDSHGLALVA
ncbi:DUF433 domain-containing protein [Aquihabitans sp. McL0605]|uniref:DUF433 domain-containing protein n=1 Tax=Aquihabitans sp. McL0605 TaxID=3415671 RepID=UPI003CEDB874